MEEIAQALGISHGSVSTVLHDRLGMRKLTARWVPKSLSDEQMATRASVCSALLKRFRSKDDFLLRLVTVDETWVHYYEPENKAQSRQWVGPRSPRPKKFKTQPSAGKVNGHKLALVFGFNIKPIHPAVDLGNQSAAACEFFCIVCERLTIPIVQA